MQNSKFIFRAALCVALACILTAGCKKEDAAVSTSSGPETNVAATQASVVEQASTGTIESAAEINSSLAQVQKAREGGNYEQAADAFLSINQKGKILNPAQAEAAHNEMRRFQTDLAAAIARGDPKAKAAAEKLRQASTVR